MWRTGVLTLLCVAASAKQCPADSPVVLFHGLGGSSKDWHLIRGWLASAHPSQPVHALDLNQGRESFDELWKQVSDFERAVVPLCNTSVPCHFVGHSQGALLARVLVQRSDLLRGGVCSLLSLAGPQQGVSIVPNTFVSLQGGGLSARPLCPPTPRSGLPRWLQNLTNELAHKVLYTSWAQRFSVAEFFHDPRLCHGYATRNVFLPIVNGEANGTTGGRAVPNSRQNLVALQMATFAGSDGDEIIAPWQSHLWGFCRPVGERALRASVGVEDSGSACPAGEMRLNETDVWLQDLVGLRALDGAGKLRLVVRPGLRHMAWLSDKPTFDELLEPLLR